MYHNLIYIQCTVHDFVENFYTKKKLSSRPSTSLASPHPAENRSAETALPGPNCNWKWWFMVQGGQNYISSLTCAALAAAVSSDRMSSVPGRQWTPLPVRGQLLWISFVPQFVWPRWRKDQWWTSPWSWDAETWRRNVWARCWGWGSCWGSQASPSWWWGTPACSASESGTWRIPTSVKRMWKLVYWRSILHHRYRFYWLALLESL